MLVIDVSGSMELIDLDTQLNRTRLEVTKEAVNTFVDGRKNDRIGMLVFATESYLQSPLRLIMELSRISFVTSMWEWFRKTALQLVMRLLLH